MSGVRCPTAALPAAPARGWHSVGAPPSHPTAPLPAEPLERREPWSPRRCGLSAAGSMRGSPSPRVGYGSARTAAARGHCPVPAPFLPRSRGPVVQRRGFSAAHEGPRGAAPTPLTSARRHPQLRRGRSVLCPAAARGRGTPRAERGSAFTPWRRCRPLPPSRRCRFRFCSAAGAKTRPGRTQNRRSRRRSGNPPRPGKGPKPPRDPDPTVRGRAARRAAPVCAL